MDSTGKSVADTALTATFLTKSATDPAALVEWVNWIKLPTSSTPIHPHFADRGHETRYGRFKIEKYLFVAVCRSLHIPARLEEITGKLQYYHNNRWHDEGGNITNQLVKNLNLASPNNLPIVIIADTFGRAVYASQGYKIGIGDELIQIIKRL